MVRAKYPPQSHAFFTCTTYGKDKCRSLVGNKHMDRFIFMLAHYVFTLYPPIVGFLPLFQVNRTDFVGLTGEFYSIRVHKF